PHSIKSESLELTAGVHPIRVEYFEAAGEESLTLEVEGPNIRRQDISALVRPTPEAKPAADAEADAAKRFVFNQDLVELGRERFVSTGCANCHELKIGNDRLASTRTAPKAITSPSDQPSGCLAESLPAGVPDFALNDDQRQALQAVVSQSQPQELSAEQKISDVLLAFNCYGCHTRGGLGGPENVRNTLFVTTIPEMGDEGRIPPILDGIGDKLETSWLNHVLKNGGKDRPYMKTRMPQFAGSLGSLSDLLVSVDQKTTAEQTVLDEPTQRIKATGRELVGGKSLACIKCHTFGDIPATGIQAIDLLTMTRRIREDWFIRYLKDPVQYRPGTRMPNVFPQGVSADRTVYEGKPGPQ
ncbi:MAG: hypothetical protein KDA78_21420, partial [Planctomycetaceae bacterium]|nr:hypothetical protein [Planctomycetaceae bacterium]